MSRKTQENYKANNLCIYCGECPPNNNRLSCEKCGNQQKQNAKNRRNKYVIDKICLGCNSKDLITKSRCQSCRDKHNQVTLNRYAVIKDEVFINYGGYICACCGELERAFLSIDHINNDGAQHRKNMSSGSNTYRWLRDNNFPNGFQVLCMNCQWGKKNCNGVCPHQTKRT